jgi:diguanylate cyclase (GGDEF)-like protein/PAS domain S-box-containing protein
MIPTDEGFYKDLLDHISDGVYFVDRDRRILYWNEGAYLLTGYKSEELLGRHCQDDILCHVDYEGHRLCHAGCPLSSCIGDGRAHEARVFLRHKQGRRLPVLVRVQPLRGADGSITGAVEIFSDDSAQIEARRKTEAMERMAFLDHLTQLPNRRYVEMSLQTALMADLNRFKEVNDSFGHACGDRVLQEAAKTLAASLRPNDTVGRWGGDEFVAIVRGVSQETLDQLARRCTAIFAQVAIPNADLPSICLTISIGATTVRNPDETPEGILRRADELMYRCKVKGQDNYVVTCDG